MTKSYVKQPFINAKRVTIFQLQIIRVMDKTVDYGGYFVIGITPSQGIAKKLQTALRVVFYGFILCLEQSVQAILRSVAIYFFKGFCDDLSRYSFGCKHISDLDFTPAGKRGLVTAVCAGISQVIDIFFSDQSLEDLLSRVPVAFKGFQSLFHDVLSTILPSRAKCAQSVCNQQYFL